MALLQFSHPQFVHRAGKIYSASVCHRKPNKSRGAPKGWCGRPNAFTFCCVGGPAVKPIALHMVAAIARDVPHLPISGIGGVQTWRDAAEFLALGSSTVQVC